MRTVRTVIAACAAMAVLFVVAPPSYGQGASNARTVKFARVDSTDSSNVTVVYRYDGPASDKATLAENGKPVDTRAPKSAPKEGVVFVIDSSASTDRDRALVESRAAVKALVDSMKGVNFAVVAAGSDAQIMQGFTTDATLVEAAMGHLTPQGDGAVWEGVSRAAGLYESNRDLVGSIVLITDGNNGKGTAFVDAKGRVLDVGATAYVVGVQGDLGDDPKTLADATGGRYASTDKAADETNLLKAMAPEIDGVNAVEYSTSSTKGLNDLTISVGGTSTQGSYLVGSLASGSRALAYQPQETPGGIKGLQNSFGKTLGIILAIAAAALGAYAIIGIFVKDQTGLASVLQPYSEGYVARSADEDEDEGGDGSAIAQTAVMQRAVEFTRQFAESRGFLSRVESALERANLPLRAAEAIFFYIVAAALFALLTAVATRNPFLVLIVLGVVVLIPPAALSFLSNRRKRQFESMLPDTLQLLSGTLRAGYSMMQGVEAVSQEVSEPMGRELRRVVTEARLGRPLEESLDSVAERMDSPDFGWAVMAIRIQREVGGNLSELLMTVAETMTQRERLKRDVKSLTAEGRISAYVLAVLPVALGFAMYALNPDYMSALFDETIGKAMLGIGVLMMIAGFMWMQAIVKIDV